MSHIAHRVASTFVFTLSFTYRFALVFTHTHTQTVSHTHIQSIRPSISINFIRFEQLMHKSGQSDVAGCSLGLPLNGQTKEVFSRRLKGWVGSGETGNGQSSVHLCAPWPQLLLTNDQFNRKTILIAQAQGRSRCRRRRRHHQGPDRTLEVEVGSGSVVVRFGYVGFAQGPRLGLGLSSGLGLGSS